ncbi:Metallo-dependent phosphatase [Auriculariales sp. MPI-PUGE-AT-0066]|nr:Metallo-dependent phosphatase [Auriculariales sp. MPI-PUGE-AT-0066]
MFIRISFLSSFISIVSCVLGQTIAVDSDKPQYHKRVVALGDLHGDYNNTLEALRLGKVIDSRGNWAGGSTTLVQVGDIFDRANDTIQIFELLDKLRLQAPLAGGKVLTHIGNHEMMNLLGDWRYVDEAEIETFGGVEKRYEAIAHGQIGQTLRKNYRITTRLPLHPAAGKLENDFDPASTSTSNLSHAALSFVHGGLAFGLPGLTPYPSYLNNLGASLVKKLTERTELPQPYPPSTERPTLPETVTQEEITFNGAEGPYWARDWALTDDSDELCQQAVEVLNSIGCERMLMGHTPLDYIMFTRCNAKIVIVDTGISRGMMDAPSALEIIYTLTPTKTRRTWVEKQVGTAFYRNDTTQLWSDAKEVVGDFEVWH